MAFAPEAMDLEASPPPPPPPTVLCSICLDPVACGEGARSTARLQCGHEFHLDCIGSAFNAKGAMQCPNCRKIEKGNWLYGNERQPCNHSDTDGWLTGETFEYPFEFGWCPFDSLTPLTSVFGESESQPTSFLDYLRVLHGFHHPMYAPSSSTASTESIPFHQRLTGTEGHATTDLRNIQVFHEIEPRSHEREQQYLGNLQMPGAVNHSTAPLGIPIPRYDGSNQQRSRPHMHPHSLFHRPTARRVSSPVAHLRSTAAVSETRGHGHGMASHIAQQTVPSSMASSPQPPTRRVRPRALSITSFIAASSSAETRGTNDFPLTETASITNSNLRNRVGAPRHANQSYSWSSETFWPPNGEPHWWSAMAPVHNQSYDNFGGRSATELLSIYGAQNGLPTPRFM
ncbi:E3 ubiquitin-protein ligase RFI2-like [Oryza brachyantha]|uniref:E3 ubiquitin-protein ligase RFI2-like n=1 Tax=Oryza brachyantha TaxID=4533 RepID=UPI001ADA7056|nr:E3 ubiquitin-protein ligase RFI2-like [Oryza brachyantha]